jgi:YD repeat-containing protein
LTKKNVYENTIAGIIEMEEQYEYDPEYLNLRKVISKTSKGDITEFEYKYPSDFPGTTPYNSMLSNNILINPIQKTITNITKNKELSKEKYNYQSWQNNSMFLPGFIEKSSGGSPLEIYAVVNEYDSKGNIIQVTGKDGIINSFIWGYNQQYLIAKVINRTYDDVISQSGINLSIVNNPTTETELKAELNKLRTISNAFVTTYTYKPLVGMTSESDPNGRTKYYEYDNFNRLALIRDQDGKILKKICYNYAGQPENCTSPCPPNSPPDWQNTTTPPTCQQGSCGNTGYQLQEQKDMNPCSSSYNTLQLVTVYNPTACPPANGVTITGNNISGLSGFTARYTNNATGQIYTFNVPTTTNTAIGCIPAGTYTLYISKPGNTMYLSFGTGCNFTVTGTSATFGRVSVTQTSGCNQVIIDGLAAD